MEWDLFKHLIKMPIDDVNYLLSDHLVLEWCNFFEIEILDNDGFSKYEFNTLINLTKFIRGIISCTINSQK